MNVYAIASKLQASYDALNAIARVNASAGLIQHDTGDMNDRAAEIWRDIHTTLDEWAQHIRDSESKWHRSLGR